MENVDSPAGLFPECGESALLPGHRAIHIVCNLPGSAKVNNLRLYGAGSQIFRDSINVSGSHRYQQITFLAICQKVLFDFLKAGEVQALMSQIPDGMPRLSVSRAG